MPEQLSASHARCGAICESLPLLIFSRFPPSAHIVKSDTPLAHIAPSLCLYCSLPLPILPTPSAHIAHSLCPCCSLPLPILLTPSVYIAHSLCPYCSLPLPIFLILSNHSLCPYCSPPPCSHDQTTPYCLCNSIHRNQCHRLTPYFRRVCTHKKTLPFAALGEIVSFCNLFLIFFCNSIYHCHFPTSSSPLYGCEKGGEGPYQNGKSLSVPTKDTPRPILPFTKGYRV